MLITDIHAHVYPDRIAEKAAQSIGAFYNLPVSASGTVSELLTHKKISRFVVHSVATAPAQVSSINSFIAASAAENPRFVGFGAMHPDFPDFEAETERIISLGLRGLKLHPDFQRFDIDDPKMFPLYALLEGRLPLLLHCGDPRLDHSAPERVAAVCRRFPRLTVIGAHFGGWSLFLRAAEVLSEVDCYVDTSSSLMFMEPGDARALIRKFGPERVLFGSDYPMWKPGEEVDRLLGLGLTDEEYEKIFYKNADELLKN
ncbi:MAG: amidohydrolase family protein [Clostridiales bacterium]|jgi:predicted TIM-barrel fold metal-dependent hydrolase|nr:amidohydrolase family protein [Clostridiales bacterium]